MADTHDPGAAAHGGDAQSTTHHETSDINIRGVFAFGVGLAIVAAFIHVTIWLLFMYFNGRESVKTAVQFPLAVGDENRLPPEPRLQTNPREDLRELRASEDAMLNGYGWVDKNNGVVHIPIGDAMKLTLQRGLPARREQKK